MRDGKARSEVRRGTRMAAPLLLIASLTSRSALSADAAASAASQQLFEEGRALVAAGNARDACPKFEESYRLDPRSGTKFNLADCYESVGRFASAWTLFLEVAAESKVAQRTDREEVARERAEALVPKLSRLSVVVPSEHRAAGLTVERSGVPVGEAQWGSPVPVDAGDHTISASAPGRAKWTTRIHVEGEGTSVSVTVPVLYAPAGARGRPADQPPREDGSGGQRIAAFVTGGAGVVGVSLGAYFGLHAMSRLDAAKDGCDGNRCQTRDGASAYDDARSAGTAATVAFAVGGTLLATGVVLYFLEPGEGKKDAGHDTAFTVSVGPGAVLARSTW